MAQKRSENTYQKINTIFKRDEKNIIMPDAEFAIPELEWLRNCKFDATEKIDGTSIRIEVVPALNVMSQPSHRNDPFMFVVRYMGKTDNAQIPGHLLLHLKETDPKEKVLEALGLPEYLSEEYCQEKGYECFEDVPMYTIYGEGYGVKI